MLRSTLHALVLLMMILQGIAQAGAHVAEGSTAHCVGHELNADDCECCSEAAMAQNGCAASCVVAAAISCHPLALSHGETDAPSSVSTVIRMNPAYLPLNPPPIS